MMFATLHCNDLLKHIQKYALIMKLILLCVYTLRCLIIYNNFEHFPRLVHSIFSKYPISIKNVKHRPESPASAASNRRRTCLRTSPLPDSIYLLLLRPQAACTRESSKHYETARLGAEQNFYARTRSIAYTRTKAVARRNSALHASEAPKRPLSRAGPSLAAGSGRQMATRRRKPATKVAGWRLQDGRAAAARSILLGFRTGSDD